MAVPVKGPGYGIRGPKRDNLQAGLAVCFATPCAILAGYCFQSLPTAIVVFLVLWGIIYGLG